MIAVVEIIVKIIFWVLFGGFALVLLIDAIIYFVDEIWWRSR